MVQSSIVIPSTVSASNSSSKRSIDSSNAIDADKSQDEEVKSKVILYLSFTKLY